MSLDLALELAAIITLAAVFCLAVGIAFSLTIDYLRRTPPPRTVTGPAVWHILSVSGGLSAIVTLGMVAWAITPPATM